jgi:hypothetical protein
MHLQNNGFTGSLDTTFCNGHPFRSLTADCRGLSPEIECSCCTLCCSADGLACAPSTEAPVTMPTLPPAVGQSRFDQLVAILSPISGAATFNDSSSPQHKAAWWLASTDGLELDFSLEVFDKVVQRYILALLYYALDGDNWTSRKNYVTDSASCLWGGTSCDAEGLVIEIDLGSNALVGSIPSEIGFFPNMKQLSLNTNSLTGAIPSSIFQMTKIEYLSLASNGLDSPIPTEIGQLTLCEVIDLCK